MDTSDNNRQAPRKWLSVALRPLPYGAGLLAICIATAIAILLWAVAVLYDVNDGRVTTALHSQWAKSDERPKVAKVAPVLTPQRPPTQNSAVTPKAEPVQEASPIAPTENIGQSVPASDSPAAENVRGVAEFPEEVHNAVFLPDVGIVAAIDRSNGSLLIYRSADMAAGASPKAEVIHFESGLTALGAERLGDRPVLLLGISSPSRLAIIDARTRRTIREIPCDQQVTSFIASSDPDDSVAYFIADEHNSPKLHQVDLRDGKILNAFNEQFAGAQPAASGDFLYVSNNQEGPWNGLKPLPYFHRRIQGDFEQFALNPTAEGKLIVSRSHDVVAVGRELYTPDLHLCVARLAFTPFEFFTNEPFLAGLEGNRLYVASTNTYQEVATLELPKKLILDPRDATSYDQSAAWRRVFHDPDNKQLIIVTPRRLLGVALERLKLPAEPLLAPQNHLPRATYSGNKETVELKFTGVEPTLQLLKAPDKSRLDGRKLTWTPTQEQYGRQKFEIEVAAKGVSHKIEWSPHVEWDRVEFGFRPAGFALSADGSRGLAWGSQQEFDPEGNKPTLNQLAVFDVTARKILTQKKLTRVVNNVVFAGDDVVALSGNQLLRFSRDKLEPQDSATIFHGGGQLRVVHDDRLVVVGGESEPRRFEVRGLKPLDPPSDNMRNYHRVAWAVGRTAFGWCWDGVLWDESLTKPRLLIQPRGFAEPIDSDQGVVAPNAPNRIMLTVPGWHPFSSGRYQSSMPESPPPVDIPARLEIVQMDGAWRLVVRGCGDNIEQANVPICPVRQYQQIGGMSSDYGVALTGKGVVAVLIGREIRIGETAAMLKAVDPPFYVEPVQSTFVLDIEKPTTVKYEAYGATSFHLDSRDLSPEINQGKWFHEESRTGEFALDVSKCLDGFAERASYMVDTRANDNVSRTNRQFVTDYIKRTEASFEQIVGHKPRGVPASLMVTVTAEGPDFQTASIYHYYLVDIPRRRVEEKLDARNPTGREVWREDDADEPRRERVTAEQTPRNANQVLSRLIRSRQMNPAQEGPPPGAAEFEAAKKKGDDRLLTAFAVDDSADESRTWTDASGRKIEASLVQEFGGQVVLRTKAGREITLEAKQLSSDNRKYLETMAAPSPPGYSAKWRRFKAKRIAAALKQFSLEHPCLPPQSLSLDGDYEAVSWRVWLLPQLGYPELFNLVRPREAWDGAANRELANHMPLCFAFDPQLAQQNKTPIVAITSPLSALRKDIAMTVETATDGPGSVIVFAECAQHNAVTWNQPVDLPLEDLRSPVGELRFRDGYVHVGLMDGTALELPQDMPRTQWRESVDISDSRRSEILSELHPTSGR